MLDACVADVRGRTNFENCAYPQAEFLARLGQSLRAADMSIILDKGLQGKELGEAIRKFRLQVIRQERKLALQNTGQEQVNHPQ